MLAEAASQARKGSAIATERHINTALVKARTIDASAILLAQT